MPATIYRNPEERFAVVERVLERIAGIPGVTAAAFTSESPLTSGGSTSAFDLKSPNADGGLVRVQASPRIVSPRFFSTLRMNVVAGRAFSERDTESSEPVVIVNQSFARRYLGGSALARGCRPAPIRFKAGRPSSGRSSASSTTCATSRPGTARSLSCSTAIVKWQGRLPWER